MRRWKYTRRGIEALEMAVILPVYVAVVLGIVEFGRAFEVAQWLTSGAREGARLAMLYNIVSQTDRNNGITTGNQKVQTDVRNFLAAAGITDGVEVHIIEFDSADPTKTVNVDDYAAVSGNYFKVLVTVPFDNVSVLRPKYLSGSTLSGEIVVRHE